MRSRAAADLIVADMAMAEEDRYELLRRVRALPGRVASLVSSGGLPGEAQLWYAGSSQAQL